jgi:signal transduction histidine kinase
VVVVVKRKLSLKFDLVFDLSMLTFFALILSQGLLIVLFRMEFPNELQDLAKDFLTPLHQSFERERSSNADQADSVTVSEAFQNYLKRSGISGSWGDVKLIVHPGQTAMPRGGPLVGFERTFLGVFPSVHEFHYFISTSDGLFEYQWSIEPFHSAITKFKYRIFLITFFVEAMLVILGYFLLFRRSILIPIKNLSDVAQAFLGGNWSARCIVERRDELGDVAEALNGMAGKIQDKEKKLVLTIESLKRANEEIEAAQNEQLQIEKLASIGRLAAGVAHEVGNPLGAISGYVDILRAALSKAKMSAEDVELCDRIEAETNRISKIIRALLQQARPTKDRIRSVKLKPVLVRSVQLAQIPSSIDLSYDFEDDEAEVMAEQDQLVQVFLNLLANSRYAIESRTVKDQQGRLKIKCTQRRLPIYRGGPSEGVDFDTSVVRSLKPEIYWVVTIEDNGVGISEGDQKKLFEPFFSTKAPGKGTGLGLYVTKSIIESFRGAIVVRSAINYGAAFSVFLRRTRSSASALET